MKYTTEFDTIKRICNVLITGEVRRPQDSTEFKLFASAFSKEHGCYRFLFDFRNARVIASTLDTFIAADPPIEMKNSLRPLKVAALHQELTENEHFFETVAFNRGFPIRVFDNYELAMKWLLEDT